MFFIFGLPKCFRYALTESDCRKADPESKGKIENVVGFIKHNYAKHRVFHNIDSRNEQVGSGSIELVTIKFIIQQKRDRSMCFPWKDNNYDQSPKM